VLVTVHIVDKVVVDGVEPPKRLQLLLVGAASLNLLVEFLAEIRENDILKVRVVRPYVVDDGLVFPHFFQLTTNNEPGRDRDFVEKQVREGLNEILHML